MKKLPLFGLLLVAVLVGLSSCTMVARPLEGTWTVTSTPTSAGTDRDLGNGTITLSYFAEFMGVELYTGTAIFDDGRFGPYSYIVEASDWTGWLGSGVTIEMNQADDVDPDTDYIEIDDAGYTGGGTLSGTYQGWARYNGGDKDIGNGTFTATK